MQVVIRVRPQFLTQDESKNVQGPSPELAKITRSLGVVLSPIHPGAPIPELASYFTAEVEDRLVADELVKRLRTTQLVDAAYVKPADELA